MAEVKLLSFCVLFTICENVCVNMVQVAFTCGFGDCMNVELFDVKVEVDIALFS